MSQISIHAIHSLKKTNKHIEPNKIYRLGKKAKKNRRTGTSIWDTRVSIAVIQPSFTQSKWNISKKFGLKFVLS
jgi:hypothetical protein